jgi:hypothetical protein
MKLRIILLAVVACVVIGLAGCDGGRPAPPPTIDAPKLASAFKWLGVCGVICSGLGATGLIIASRNHRNRGRK